MRAQTFIEADVQVKGKKDYLIKSKNNEVRKVFFLFIHWLILALENVPETESVPEFCSICPRKISFVPENIPESPRMASEKYGMYEIRTRQWVQLDFVSKSSLI